MLKSISLQLGNEEQQLFFEKKIANQIHNNFNKNIVAIRQNIPSLLEYVQFSPTEEYSIFVNKIGNINIVSLKTGQALYQLDPVNEVREEVQAFRKSAPFVSVKSLSEIHKYEPLPLEADCLFIFGLGLGHHVVEIIKNCKINFLVIYEPNLDFFKCSLNAIDWEHLFELARIQNTQISIQIGSAAMNIVDDLAELYEVFPNYDRVYLYRHLCYPIVDDVFNFLINSSGKPELLLKTGRQFLGYTANDDYIDIKPSNCLGLDFEKSYQEDKDFYSQNLNAFKKFYPEIYQMLNNYRPKNWILTHDEKEMPNLWHKDRKAFFYLDFLEDSKCIVNTYLKEPFKDDVIVGVEKNKKLQSFIHFSYIEKLQNIFTLFKKENYSLPEKVESLIVFGIGLAKHVEQLVEQRDINNLYIFEPNIDFFYASLFITDWSDIFFKADACGKRIYLNIGGDGSEYFNDLMGQFYQVGAYSIANTYLLPSYYTPQLAKSINSLRKQLKVVLSIGEYYDHARYGIAHTYISLTNNNRYMKDAAVISKVRDAVAEIPVFIIGNGPSLDGLAGYIKKYRNRVVVLSCGTALGSLFKLGIQPDFHAEVEQNRAPYDWITQIKDKDYLKGIKLISVNGIHPDISSLFENTYLAFKSGDSSTHIFQGGLEKQGYSFSSLSYAYPTVSNLALNYIMTMGFKTIYLMGVDLGFHDVSMHHSSLSAYYKPDGQEVYDYKLFHGEGFPVKGNFAPLILTKPEFDVSRQLLERVVKQAQVGVEIYNCSDGAFIEGCRPLKPEYILLEDLQKNITDELEHYLEKIFYSPEFSDASKAILNDFDFILLEKHINEWVEMINYDVETADQAKECINKQWIFLKDNLSHKDSILFHLFYGSSTYFLSLLTKSIHSERSFDDFSVFNEILGLWRSYLKDACTDFVQNPIKSDSASSGMF